MTRRSAVVRIDVTNADRIVAVAQGTCTIVDPKPRDGAGLVDERSG